MNTTMTLRHLRQKEKVIVDSKPEVATDSIPSLHLFAHLCKLQELERVAEIGVFGGNLTKRVIQNCPSIKEYYAVDPWKVYIESYDRPPHARETKQDWWESIYQKVVDFQKLHPEVIKIKRMESIKCAKELREVMDTDDKKFDAVYIDSIHDAPNLVNDIWCWLPLIKDYGTICGHDYIKRYTNMMIALEDIFEEHFNFWLIDKKLDAHTFKNQGQGGNWWCHLTPKKKEQITSNIKTKYSKLLFMGNQDECE